jgi:hypothetical protein
MMPAIRELFMNENLSFEVKGMAPETSARRSCWPWRRRRKSAAMLARQNRDKSDRRQYSRKSMQWRHIRTDVLVFMAFQRLLWNFRQGRRFFIFQTDLPM